MSDPRVHVRLTVDDHLADAIALNSRTARQVWAEGVARGIERDGAGPRGRLISSGYSARHARRHPRAATPARAVVLWLRRCAVVVLLLVAAGLVGLWWSAPVPAPTPADYPVVQIGDVDPSPVVAP